MLILAAVIGTLVHLTGVNNHFEDGTGRTQFVRVECKGRVDIYIGAGKGNKINGVVLEPGCYNFKVRK